MASHTMQLAGKRKILQILQETNNSTPRDKNISNTYITGKLKQICWQRNITQAKLQTVTCKHTSLSKTLLAVNEQPKHNTT
jgi:hypothetical protein